VILDGVEKGKGRATGIIGLSPEPPQPLPFTLPSLTTACHQEAEHWPKRISPSSLSTPLPCQERSSVEMILSAKTGEQLGDLLLKLIEWIIEPRVIDLTLEEPGSSFQPPAHTNVMPVGNQMPTDVLVLIAQDTTYFMYV